MNSERFLLANQGSGLKRRAYSFDQIGSGFRVAIQRAETAAGWAQIARREAEPAAGGVVIGGEMVEQQGVEIGRALKKLGGDGPDEES